MSAQGSLSSINPVWIRLSFCGFYKGLLLSQWNLASHVFNSKMQQKFCLVFLKNCWVESLHAQHMLMFKLRNEITCNTCFDDSSNEESSSLLQLAMSNSIQTALSSSLQAETLSGDNPVCCNFYFPLKSAFVVPAFSKVGRYLVIQLKRFVSHHNQVIKDIKHVQCALKFLCQLRTMKWITKNIII